MNEQTKKLIEDFFAEKRTDKVKLNGKCRTGNRKDCKFLQYREGKEVCRRGWCLCH